MADENQALHNDVDDVGRLDKSIAAGISWATGKSLGWSIRWRRVYQISKIPANMFVLLIFKYLFSRSLWKINFCTSRDMYAFRGIRRTLDKRNMYYQLNAYKRHKSCFPRF